MNCITESALENFLVSLHTASFFLSSFLHLSLGANGVEGGGLVKGVNNTKKETRHFDSK